MYNQDKDVRLARANTPIRRMVKPDGKVWLYLSEKFLNDFALKHPYDYLRRLSQYARALYFQTFYFVDKKKNIHIACSVVKDDQPSYLEFIGHIEGEDILITDIKDTCTTADWNAVKLETRRIAKAKCK